MLTEEREVYILEALKENGTVKLQSLIQSMDVSESTIRRDLSNLEDRGLLTRVHGGAKLNYKLDIEPSYDEKNVQNNHEKIIISKKAAQMVDYGDTIYLDAGTTTEKIIDFLDGKPSLVVTNGLQQAVKLMQLGYKTVLIGGNIKKETQAIIGSVAQQQLLRYRFDKVFIGINGVHPDFGLTTADEEEAIMKELAIKQSSRSFVVCDNSKFQKVSFCKVVNLDEATIITNELDNNMFEQYNSITTIIEVK